MAHDDALEQYHQSVDQLRISDDRALCKLQDRSLSSATDNHDYVDVETVNKLFPTPDQIKSRAEELYQFVAEE
tara:strand:- start:267 stop:485 length:219 start_codon:yes stop_codon:yes gene_type:complete